MAGQMVAFLEVQPQTWNPQETQAQIAIRGHEEFYLGRHPALCRYHWPDTKISNKHVRIHCLLYEESDDSPVPPLVYATDVSTNGTYLKKSYSEYASPQGRGILMGRNKSAYLLDDGDEIRLADVVTLVYRSRLPAEIEKLDDVQNREAKLFSDRYLITKRILGSGGFGHVFIGVHKKTQRQLACKVININVSSPLTAAPNPRSLTRSRKRWPTKVAKSFREFRILERLNHPNIVTLEKVFLSSKTIFMFQELVTGGDLFSYLTFKGGKLGDVETAVIVRQVLKGIDYLHAKDIAHRDLKPDNILLTSLDDGARVIITDFGSARQVSRTASEDGTANDSRKRMASVVGTLEYVAPEVHKANPVMAPDKGYSKKIDMWSIGAITYTLLSGYCIFADYDHPYYNQDPELAIMGLAARCDLSSLDDKGDGIWPYVGHRAKDFIKRLLVLNEGHRMSASEALAHHWFTNRFHAAEFEALYEKAVKDWQPQRRIFKPVEDLSQLRSGPFDLNLPEQVLSQEAVSHSFAPPPHASCQYDVTEAIAISPNRRVKTSLPSNFEVPNEEQYIERIDPPPDEIYNNASYHVYKSYPLHPHERHPSVPSPGGHFSIQQAPNTCDIDGFTIPAPPPMDSHVELSEGSPDCAVRPVDPDETLDSGLHPSNSDGGGDRFLIAHDPNASLLIDPDQTQDCSLVPHTPEAELDSFVPETPIHSKQSCQSYHMDAPKKAGDYGVSRWAAPSARLTKRMKFTH